ncbi:UNVERIFIED_CONTAM: hypothetical protein FKN15_058986 [Acipenser sinensis]
MARELHQHLGSLPVAFAAVPLHEPQALTTTTGLAAPGEQKTAPCLQTQWPGCAASHLQAALAFLGTRQGQSTTVGCPGHSRTYVWSRGEMLQRSHCVQESTKELVRLLPKRPPPAHKPAKSGTLGPSNPKNWHSWLSPLPEVMLSTGPRLLAPEAIIDSTTLLQRKVQSKPQAAQQP